MTMAIENQQRYGAIPFDHMPYSAAATQFTNPWGASTAPPTSHSLYASSLSASQQQQQQQQQHHQPPPMAHQPPRLNNNVNVTMGYANGPISAVSADMMNASRPLSAAYGDPAAFSSAPSAAPYETMGYAPAPVRSTYNLPQAHDGLKRLSQSSVLSSSSFLGLDGSDLVVGPNTIVDLRDSGVTSESARAFGEAVDASRGMIAMSQHTTPRNIYEAQGGRGGRGSADSYGFPSTHSAASSVSSQSSFPHYFGGSVDSSVSDYSNAGSDHESVSSRTLPRPSGFLGGALPPAPQSMMGQFSSKISSSTQKKHKCKVCDKRFTRPSSLQTHMYSHTGEKPFTCEVEGCGRNFSVVSNLRRHRKVHKGEAMSETSEDHHSDD